MQHGQTDPTARTELLFQLMRERLELLQSLQQVGVSCGANQLEDGGALLAVLGRKSSIIDRLNENQQLLQTFGGEDPDSRVWSSAERRVECQQLATVTERLLRDIIQSENSLLDNLTCRRDAIAEQLQQGRDSVLAANAYSASSTLDGGLLDISDG